jgi:hypothetical protein
MVVGVDRQVVDVHEREEVPMKNGSYRCLLSRGERCAKPATVQRRDRDGSQTRGCFPHAYEALKALDGARVVWSRTRVNELARAALELAEQRIGGSTA